MRASVEGVEAELVVGGQVDVFNDVDFAVVWPVLSLAPISWPNGALQRRGRMTSGE